MIDTFPKDLRRAVNLLLYGVDKTEVADTLAADGVDKTQAILIVIAAQKYIRDKTHEETNYNEGT